LVDVVAEGDRRASLEAVRDRLAAAMGQAEPNVIAQIAGRLQAVMREIADLPVAEKVSKADELAARRKARRAAAARGTSAAGKGNKRGS
jgi:hypothetical protein